VDILLGYSYCGESDIWSDLNNQLWHTETIFPDWSESGHHSDVLLSSGWTVLHQTTKNQIHVHPNPPSSAPDMCSPQLDNPGGRNPFNNKLIPDRVYLLSNTPHMSDHYSWLLCQRIYVLLRG
jgi:hypothetical protein